MSLTQAQSSGFLCIGENLLAFTLYNFIRSRYDTTDMSVIVPLASHTYTHTHVRTHARMWAPTHWKTNVKMRESAVLKLVTHISAQRIMEMQLHECSSAGGTKALVPSWVWVSGATSPSQGHCLVKKCRTSVRDGRRTVRFFHGRFQSWE